MDNKLNYNSIEAYSAAYTKKLINNFFSMEESINGKQILTLSSIQQVNLLIIKNLFQKWKKETGKLQSPYFDYDDEEVRKALQHFMNVLSNHITIKKNHFEPLLKKSVTDAIFLIFSPYIFYSKEINHPERTRISLNDLIDIGKYVKVNKLLLDNLIRQFKEQDISVVFNDEGISIFNEVYENSDLPVVSWDEYFKKFSEIHPLTFDMIFEEGQDESSDEDFVKPLVKDNEKAGFTREKKETETIKNLNERFHKPQKTLHEQLASKPSSTLADLHQRNKISSIKKYITLNQKFMFINELFSGHQPEYQEAIERLETSSNHREALSVIKVYQEKHQWDNEAEEAKEFLEIIAKKFS